MRHEQPPLPSVSVSGFTRYRRGNELWKRTRRSRILTRLTHGTIRKRPVGFFVNSMQRKRTEKLIKLVFRGTLYEYDIIIIIIIIITKPRT